MDLGGVPFPRPAAGATRRTLARKFNVERTAGEFFLDKILGPFGAARESYREQEVGLPLTGYRTQIAMTEEIKIETFC